MASSSGSGLHFASVSVQGPRASTSVVSGHKSQYCAANVFERVLAYHLLLLLLPLLHLGLL